MTMDKFRRCNKCGKVNLGTRCACGDEKEGKE